MSDEKKLDCGDNSCLFAEHKGGMRTNGGCRCLDKLGLPRWAQSAIHRRVLGLMGRVQRLSSGPGPRE